LGYLSAWKVLEEMIVDLRKKGMAVPAKIMNDLKSARTLINVLKADSTQMETTQRIEEYLTNVESYIVSEGQKGFGTKYVEEWLKRLDAAGKKPFEEEGETRFIPGVPREHKWIRVKPSAELSIEKLKKLTGDLTLSFNVQKDGSLLVYGKDERIKEFVRKIATEYGLKMQK
jgi:hypothetical protein